METTKNICYMKGDLTIVTKWCKKFHSGCKNLDIQAMSGRPKNHGFKGHAPSHRIKSDK